VGEYPLISRIIVVSGQVCAGKTTLATSLAARFGVSHVKTSHCILALRPDVERERRAMQEVGEAFDRDTGGRWVLDGLRKHLSDRENDASNTIVVLDAARIEGQIEAIRRGYGHRVMHIHLEASETELSRRYQETKGQREFKELPTYSEVMANATEAGVKDLAHIADVIISSERSTPEDVLLRVASHAGLFGKQFERVVDVVVGGQYGSEGKGQIVAHMAPEYDVLVRVGGPNAGHTVWQEPEPFTFHHLPSGTNTNPRARLIIGAGAVIRVKTLQHEIGECQVERDRLVIDPQAMIISDEDIAAEAKYRESMGSTAQGVGQATARRILDRNIDRSKCTIAENVLELRPYIRSAVESLDEHFRLGHSILLEGTQGTGLSLYHGSYPYVTSRDSTVAGCLAEAGISPSRVRKVVMVCRTYPIRVQNPEGSTSGPMSRQIEWATVAERSGISLEELLRTEKTSTTKRSRRVSEFDWSLVRRSASLNAPTDVALTFVDYIRIENREANRMDQLTAPTLRFVEEVERITTAPVSLLSVRFHSRGVIDRRRW
jgi:adenylosuccinate synthase